jgi:hypothetical protein
VDVEVAAGGLKVPGRADMMRMETSQEGRGYS